MLVSDVIARVGHLLKDEGVRWTQTELVRWFNDAQAEIVRLRPDANMVSASLALVEGAHQRIPANGVLLGEVFANMGTDGLTPGDKVSEVSRHDLDAYTPAWRTATPAATVKHIMRDQDKPKEFWVYPPQPATDPGYVFADYSAIPDEQGVDDTVYLPVEYANSIVDYMTYRAFSKDTEGANVARATAHYQAFMQAMGLTEAANAAAGAR